MVFPSELGFYGVESRFVCPVPCGLANFLVNPMRCDGRRTGLRGSHVDLTFEKIALEELHTDQSLLWRGGFLGNGSHGGLPSPLVGGRARLRLIPFGSAILY